MIFLYKYKQYYYSTVYNNDYRLRKTFNLKYLFITQKSMRINHKIKLEHLLMMISNASKYANIRVEPIVPNLDEQMVLTLNDWLIFYNNKTISEEIKLSKDEEFFSLFKNYTIRVIDNNGPLRSTNIDEYIHILTMISKTEIPYTSTVQNFTFDENNKINLLCVNSHFD